MAGPSSHLVPSSIVALAALGALGCSSLFAYPTPRAETAPFCADGEDNDFDGRIDCADPDCTDTDDCTRLERDLDCFNGQDDDRDGYPDRADPLCWHFYADPWERCESTRTVAVSEGFDDPATSRWSSLDPSAPRVVASPLPDARVDMVGEIVPGPRAFSRTTLVSGRGELRILGRWLVPMGAEGTLQLWDARATASPSEVREDGLLAAVRLRRTEAGLELTLSRGIDTAGPVLVPSAEDGWFELGIQVSCGRAITATIGETQVSVGSGDCYARSTSPTFAPLGPLGQTELRLGLFAMTAPVWIDDLHAEGLGSETCGRRLPRLVSGEGAVDPPTAPQILSIAQSGDPESEVETECDQPEPHLCALVLDRGTGRVEPWVSREAEGSPWARLGMLWTRGAPFSLGSVSDASVEWTWMGACAEQNWRATVRSIHGTRVFESPDCEQWTEEVYLIADVDESWDWHAYFVRAALGDQRIPQREEVYAARRGTTGLVFGRAHRQRNVFSWTGLTVLNEREPAQVALELPIALSRVGTIDQLLIGRDGERGLRLHVVPSGIGGEVLAWQGGLNAFEYTDQLDPSSLPGTHDRWEIDSGAVIVARESDGNPFALALYTSSGDFDGPPEARAPAIGVACRQVSRRNPPCEEADPITGAGCGDGFCFGNENCAICPSDCGGECLELPQVLGGLSSDRPATAHPVTGGAFTWIASPIPAYASAPIRGGGDRTRVQFDVTIDGDSDACAVRVGIGEAPRSELGPVGDLVEVALEGDLVRFRPMTRASDGEVRQASDESAAASYRGRWQHVVLERAEETLEVHSGELDVLALSPRSSGPRGSMEPTTIWVEVPANEGRCRGRIRNLVVE